MGKTIGKLLLIAGIALALTGCGEADKAYNTGMELATQGKYEKSLPYFEKAIEEKDDQAEYYIGYGMALNRLNRFEEAKEEFLNVIQGADNKISKKNDKQIYYGLAIAQYGLGDYASVEEYCEKALSISYLKDMDCDILYTGMLALCKQEQWEQAKQNCQQIIQKDDEYFDAYLALAKIERNLGNNAEAAQVYLDAIAKDKTYYEAYFALYEQYCYAGQEDAANELLNQLLKIKPNKAKNMMVIGRAYYYKKEYDKAKEYLSMAYDGKCTESKYYMGLIYTEEQSYDEAVSAFQTYIKENKDDLMTEAYYQLALVYMAQREFAKAQSAIDKGIARGNTSAMQDLKRTQVILKEKQNQYEEALSLATEYLKIYPSDTAMKKEKKFIKTRI